MRLPNGFGNVSKLSGKRRRPWRARKTVGWEYRDKETGKVIADPKDPSKVRLHQLYEIVGYFETRADAIAALSNYIGDPEEKIAKTITFKEVYDRWSEKHFARIQESSISTWKTAFKRCSSIYNIPVAELRLAHLEACINKAPTAITKAKLRQLLVNVFNYSENHSFISKNYAKMLDTIQMTSSPEIHKIFLPEEVEALETSSTKMAEVLLFAIYSGFRPKEILDMEKENIDLDQGIIVNAGSKTEAGRKRIVPIHSKVMPIIKKYMGQDNYKLFGIPNRSRYRLLFNEEMKNLGMEHLPYDTRHSFITYAKESGMDEYILKTIVGHKIIDLTERVYTHRLISSIKQEMEKFEIVSYASHM